MLRLLAVAALGGAVLGLLTLLGTGNVLLSSVAGGTLAGLGVWVGCKEEKC